MHGAGLKLPNGRPFAELKQREAHFACGFAERTKLRGRFAKRSTTVPSKVEQNELVSGIVM
jgi:hypothetical protein